MRDTIYEIHPKEEECFKFSRVLNFKVRPCSVRAGLCSRTACLLTRPALLCAPNAQPLQYSSSMQKVDPDHIIALVTEVIPAHSCLVFCPSKKNCENVADMICKYLKKYVVGPPPPHFLGNICA